jgi:hypothetical protein
LEQSNWWCEVPGREKEINNDHVRRISNEEALAAQAKEKTLAVFVIHTTVSQHTTEEAQNRNNDALLMFLAPASMELSSSSFTQEAKSITACPVTILRTESGSMGLMQESLWLILAVTAATRWGADGIADGERGDESVATGAAARSSFLLKALRFVSSASSSGLSSLLSPHDDASSLVGGFIS